MNILGTKTEQNLKDAFIGESMARNKYTFFSSQAKKDGYEYVAKIFEEIANNEKEHAKVWFKLLQGGSINKTIENLKMAIEGERYEWSQMYKKFAQEAKEEGFDEIARLFEEIRIIEKSHDKKYETLLNSIKDDTMFSRDTKVMWHCLNCGYRYESENAPELCPFCSHSKAYFEQEL